jgi:hypothetical protein
MSFLERIARLNALGAIQNMTPVKSLPARPLARSGEAAKKQILQNQVKAAPGKGLTRIHLNQLGSAGGNGSALMTIIYCEFLVQKTWGSSGGFRLRRSPWLKKESEPGAGATYLMHLVQ